jgi:hypothetical protein
MVGGDACINILFGRMTEINQVSWNHHLPRHRRDGIVRAAGRLREQAKASQLERTAPVYMTGVECVRGRFGAIDIPPNSL